VEPFDRLEDLIRRDGSEVILDTSGRTAFTTFRSTGKMRLDVPAHDLGQELAASLAGGRNRRRDM
jgi:hypothetical protein